MSSAENYFAGVVEGGEWEVIIGFLGTKGVNLTLIGDNHETTSIRISNLRQAEELEKAFGQAAAWFRAAAEPLFGEDEP